MKRYYIHVSHKYYYQYPERMSSNGNRLEVLTFVMKVEYNGFQYAGFQRQTATHTARNNVDNTFKNHKRLQSQQHHQISNKKAKKGSNITVQHEIEMALQKWTNLSIATLRVRGAGRTDKGVHSTGQVAAFDIPVKLLNLNGIKQDDYKQYINSNSCDGNNIGKGGSGEESLSEHCIKYLHEAYHTFNAHYQSKSTNNGEDGNNITKFMDQWQMRRAISTRLPPDIIIRSVRMYTGSKPFEPRKEISCKTYIYKLRFRQLSYLDDGNMHSSCSNNCNTQQKESNADDDQQRIHPICNAGPHILRQIDDNNSVWLCLWPLDPILLQKACASFVGRHDFVNFVHKEERKKIHANNPNNGVDVIDSNISPHEIDLFEFKVDIKQEVEEDTTLPPVLNATFTLKAKGFHRSMVRSLVGFVVDVARGIQTVDDIPVLLLEKKTEDANCSDNTSLASMVNSAPACGLCLAKVEYEHSNFL